MENYKIGENNIFMNDGSVPAEDFEKYLKILSEKEKFIYELLKPYIVKTEEIDPKFNEKINFADNALDQYFKNLGFKNIKKLPAFFVDLERIPKEDIDSVKNKFSEFEETSGETNKFFCFVFLENSNDLREANIYEYLRTYAHEIYHSTRVHSHHKHPRINRKNSIRPILSSRFVKTNLDPEEKYQPINPAILEEGAAVNFEEDFSEMFLKEYGDEKLKEWVEDQRKENEDPWDFTHFGLNSIKNTSKTFNDDEYASAWQIHKLLEQAIPNYCLLLEDLRINNNNRIFEEINDYFGKDLAKKILSNHLSEAETIASEMEEKIYLRSN